MKNYKYQVLQGIKSNKNNDYNQYDLMGEFTSLREARKCFNKYKKLSSCAFERFRVYKETILQKVYDNDEYEDKTEYLEVEEWEFYRYNKYRM